MKKIIIKQRLGFNRDIGEWLPEKVSKRRNKLEMSRT